MSFIESHRCPFKHQGQNCVVAILL